MRVLILGVTGMLGHRLFLELSKRHEVHATARSSSGLKEFIDYFEIDANFIRTGLTNDRVDYFKQVIEEIKPDMIVNCIGIIKQVKDGRDHITSIAVNSLFPHQIAKISRECGARFIHMSTDCVFTGTTGMYTEKSVSDALDLYGRSKQMGEVDYLDNSLTIRTSIIGREIKPHGGLLEWFLGEKSPEIKGFSKAIFSGFPTKTLANVIDQYVLESDLSGLYHLSVDPIDKFSLLVKFNNLFRVNKVILENTDLVIDRSLDSTRFREATGFSPASWDQLIEDLNVDSDFYDLLREQDKA